MIIPMNVNDLNYLFTCTKCKEEKPNSDFNRKAGQRRVRLFNSICKVCANEKAQDWTKKNPEKRKAISKRWIQNNPEKSKEVAKNHKKKHPISYYFNSCRGNAKKRNLEFNITLEEVLAQYELQKGLCYYTNDEMFYGIESPDSISIDRIDSSKGYYSDNIVLCKSKVNVMKNDVSLEYLFDFCEKVLKNKENIMQCQ